MTLRLDACLGSHDNNFNLLRMIAASAVLVSHSYALVAGGSPQHEPLRAALGFSLGSLAVDLFFITSGFLVTDSLLRRRDAAGFVRARMRRIYPALWVAILLCTFVIGLYWTTLTPWDYLRHL